MEPFVETAETENADKAEKPSTDEIKVKESALDLTREGWSFGTSGHPGS